MLIKIKKNLTKSKVFYDMERDGITQSLISLWLSCRQKARMYLDGWDSKYHSPALTYGSIGHGMLELAYLDIQAGILKTTPTTTQVKKYSKIIEAKWRAENLNPNKEALEYLEVSLALMEVTLPRYFMFWKKDFKSMKWISLEKKFNIGLKIENGISIPIRGKRDGEFRLNGLWLFETKFKSMISEGDLLDTLNFDFQVMLYLWALLAEKNYKEYPKGVLYNVVRRTALKQKVNESINAYARRVGEDIDKRPDFYFLRLESVILPEELKKFEKDLKEIVIEMFQWWKGVLVNYKNPYSCLGKYGRCQYLNSCSRNDFSGLVKRKAMFKELEDF